MALTYRQAANILSLFLRKGSAKKIDDQTLIGKLLIAIKDEVGDFDRTDFSSDNIPITTSIWYKKGISHPAIESPPAFSFEFVINALGTLSSAIPVLGSGASAAFGVVGQLSNNLGESFEWWKNTLEASNPSTSPLDSLKKDIVGHIDENDIENDINMVFGKIISLQGALNNVLVAPKDLAVSGTPSIKTKPHYTKSFVLGKSQIGAVFEIVNMPEFQQLMNASNDWVNKELKLGLHMNPTYSNATLNAFVHASIVIVNAFMAYSLLYLFPDEAFSNPTWDRSGLDIRHELETAGKVQLIDGLPTAWDALSHLETLLNPTPDSNNFISRLDERNDCWMRIFNRLSLVDYGLKPFERDNFWFLASDTHIDLRLPVGKLFYVIQYLTEVLEAESEAVPNQFVCSDTSILSSNADNFTEPFRHFQTELSITWLMGNDPGSVFTYALSGQSFTAGVGTAVAKLNATLNNVKFPLHIVDKNGAVSQVSSGYKDVFWSAWGPTDTENPENPGFLGLSNPRDVVGWLGMVLMNYCIKYRFAMDLVNDTNTFEIAEVVRQNFVAVHETVEELLGIKPA